MKESIKKIYNSFIEFHRQGSNWTIDKVVNLASLKFRSDILPLYFQTRSPLRRGGYKATMTDHMKHLLSLFFTLIMACLDRKLMGSGM
jgi:hypothetical protein